MGKEPVLSGGLLSRRALIGGSLAALALGATGVGIALERGGSPSGVPNVAGMETTSGSFRSARRGGALTGWTLARPQGRRGTAVPVLVALHGRGGDHSSAFGGGLHLDRFLADAVQRGTPLFAVASVDGGDHSYWHPRRDGDSAGMVVHELLPLLAAHGLDTTRIGLLGWSMGGYGALYLAGALGSSRVAVAVAESPAIWHRAEQSAAGAFDDVADFDAHAIFGRLDRLAGVALRVDCGDRDGFAPITRALRAALAPTPAGGIEAGGHDYAFWRSQVPAQLAFVGARLAG